MLLGDVFPDLDVVTADSAPPPDLHGSGQGQGRGQLAAEKIQRGLAADNDLTSRERDLFHAAKRILAPLETPLLSAVEEYVKVRSLLGDLPLLTVVQG